MGDVVQIGRPATFGRSIRYMSEDEARSAHAEAAARELVELRSNVRRQATRLFQFATSALGEHEARKLMLEVAKELFKE